MLDSSFYHSNSHLHTEYLNPIFAIVFETLKILAGTNIFNSGESWSCRNCYFEVAFGSWVFSVFPFWLKLFKSEFYVYDDYSQIIEYQVEESIIRCRSAWKKASITTKGPSYMPWLGWIKQFKLNFTHGHFLRVFIFPFTYMYSLNPKTRQINCAPVVL